MSAVRGDRFDYEREMDRGMGAVYSATKGMFHRLRRVQVSGDVLLAGCGLEDDLRLDASLFALYVLLYHV